ncbi:hypothetical protein XaFJ1_GM003013 [Xanthomonas albilineans]|nr:hypothetical protein XaFJ1_GM003013 [Xanthomonas albilineans]
MRFKGDRHHVVVHGLNVSMAAIATNEFSACEGVAMLQFPKREPMPCALFPC